MNLGQITFSSDNSKNNNNNDVQINKNGLLNNKKDCKKVPADKNNIIHKNIIVPTQNRKSSMPKKIGIKLMNKGCFRNKKNNHLSNNGNNSYVSLISKNRASSGKIQNKLKNKKYCYFL